MRRSNARTVSVGTALIFVCLFRAGTEVAATAAASPSRSCRKNGHGGTFDVFGAQLQQERWNHRCSSSSSDTIANLRGGQQEAVATQMDKLRVLVYAALQRVATLADKHPVIREKVLPCLRLAVGVVIAAVTDLTVPQRVLMALTLLFGVWLGRLEPFWRSYRTITDVPGRRFGPKAFVLVGRAAAITDGDTIRLYHTPLPWQRLPKQVSLTSQTIPIRICTIDTPEISKFGREGQPMGEEARRALRDMIGKGKVYVRLLRQDHYGRGVAQVWIRGWHGQRIHMDSYMLKKGLAEVYEGPNAVYGPKGKRAYKHMEQQAKRKRIGIWALTDRETAAEYKRRTA